MPLNKLNIAVLTGAGISAESGLGTFRGNNGLWDNHKIEDVASYDGFKRNPKLVLDFYNMRRRQCLDALPNAAHFGLKKLEEKYDVNIVTQNIDDLHERAGSKNVLHLHGEILKMRSVLDDNKRYDILSDINVGDKAPDGGQLRPDVVWFGEAVPKIEEAISIMQKADIFILIGSSLVVYPAAGLMDVLGNDVPKYVIDKEISHLPYLKNIVAIEKKATEGMEELLSYLVL
ncbi:MAG: NAD-dependent protein deacylase [Pseudopedobacter saltans]|uniref:protein acetyllysine N-acetyltransferase n=1 Tax=Pseudopedobacter saltans TaxID=151895 RepID=A0A2W5GVJ8_9SPHI|nr:MAG: NAD-dependent protein deacylase [Pseudopedobacter saltans]